MICFGKVCQKLMGPLACPATLSEPLGPQIGVACRSHAPARRPANGPGRFNPAGPVGGQLVAGAQPTSASRRPTTRGQREGLVVSGSRQEFGQRDALIPTTV